MLGFDTVGELALGEFTEEEQATAPVFSSWPSSAARKTGLSVAVIATTFAGFVPPPPAEAAPVFSSFSQPQVTHNAALQGEVSFDVTPPPPSPPPEIVFTGFSRFDEFVPAKRRDEGFVTSAQIIPALPPFTGFATFDQPIRKKITIADFQQWTIAVPEKQDRHDGIVFVKKKRKPQYDPVKDELDQREKRRGAIYDALHGPEVEYTLPDLVLPPRAKTPDVTELAQVVFAARQAAEADRIAQEFADDEADLDLILKDIL